MIERVTTLRYVVLGRPVSWQRTNIVRGRPVTDAKQRSAKKLHQYAAMLAFGHAVGEARALHPRAGGGRWDLDGAFAIEVRAFYPTLVMGDIDRILGLPLDAMQGLLYRDDRQVSRAVCDRLVDAVTPRVEVTVTRTGDAPALARRSKSARTSTQPSERDWR